MSDLTCIKTGILQFGSLVWHTEGIITKGEAKDTETEARESAAEAAILSLEMVCSVYLIDITYNKRSLAEARVLETESVLNASAQLLSEIQSDWEGEVGKLGECTDHYKNILTEHDSIDYSEEFFLVKWECTEPIVVLHEACPTRIQNRRLQP
jgi:hypothetical protein